MSPNGLLNDLRTLSGVFGEGSVVGFLGGVSGLGGSFNGTFSGKEGNSVVSSDYY